MRNFYCAKLIIISMLCAVLVSISLSHAPVFEDLEVYYGIYTQMQYSSFYETAERFHSQTGKFEPLILLIFKAYQLVLGDSYELFLISNFFFINIGSCIVADRYLSVDSSDLRVLPFLFALISYSFFSREIYILRTMYGLIFLIVAIFDKRVPVKITTIILAVLAHQTMLVYWALFFVGHLSFHYFKRYGAYFILTSISAIAVVLLKMPSIFSYFVSGGELTIFLDGNDSHTIISLAVLLLTGISLFAFLNLGVISTELRSFVSILLMLTVISLFNYDHYHLMNRLAAPAIIITPFIILLNRFSILEPFRKFYALSALGSFRLMVIFCMGGFAA